LAGDTVPAPKRARARRRSNCSSRGEVVCAIAFRDRILGNIVVVRSLLAVFPPKLGSDGTVRRRLLDGTGGGLSPIPLTARPCGPGGEFSSVSLDCLCLISLDTLVLYQSSLCLSGVKSPLPAGVTPSCLGTSPGDSISACSLTWPIRGKLADVSYFASIFIVVEGVSSFDTFALSHVFHSMELVAEISRLWKSACLHTAWFVSIGASPWLWLVGGDVATASSLVPVSTSSVVHE